MNELGWEVMCTLGSRLQPDKLIESRFGSGGIGKSGNAIDRLFDEKSSAGLSTEERDRIYMEALAEVGMHITQDQIDQARKNDAEKREVAKVETQSRRHNKGNIRWQHS